MKIFQPAYGHRRGCFAAGFSGLARRVRGCLGRRLLLLEGSKRLGGGVVARFVLLPAPWSGSDEFSAHWILGSVMEFKKRFPVGEGHT